MNRSTPRNLGIVLFALVAILVGMEIADRSGGPTGVGGLLFEDLKDRINDVEQITVEASGEEVVVVERSEGGWVVRNRDGYPADVARVREALIALSNARIVELKTSNPDRYEAIGVRDPEEDGAAGRRFTATAGDVTFSVIIGDTAAGSNRFVRPKGEERSLLIDASPDLPEDAAGWLDSALLDIEASTLKAVSIEHADGESLGIEKSSRDEANFTVANIPEGRELSYPTAANSIAGALNDLELEDVRRPADAEASSVTTFTSFDGLVVRARVFTDDEDSSWVAFEASAIDPPMGEGDDPAEDASAEAEDADAESSTAETPVDVGARAAEIDARVRGWEFRIPDYKANQLTRRWDDILAEVEEEEED